MTAEMILSLILFFVGIVFSALFSGFENGMVSIRKARLDHAVAEGSFLAMLIKRMLNRPARMLATILLGNNLTNCLTAVYFGKLTEEVLRKLNIGDADSMLVAVFSAAVLTLIMLILAEITPKVWFRQHPFARCRMAVVPVFIFFVITYPFVLCMTLAVTIMNKLLSQKAGGDIILMREDFRVMLKESVEEGMLNPEDQLLLENSLGFNKQTAGKLMIERDQVTAVHADMTLAEAVAISRSCDRARFPVYEQDNEERWIGMFSVYDALFLVPQREWGTATIRPHLRPLTSIPRSTGVADVLQCSRLNSSPFLVVTDKDDNHLGIITTEDAVRPLFGTLKV